MDPAAVLVPVHVYVKVAFSVPVNGTFIVLLRNFGKMVGVLPPNIVDANVVDVALLGAVLVELFYGEILCRDACLRETTHALLYFDVDCTVIGSQSC